MKIPGGSIIIKEQNYQFFPLVSFYNYPWKLSEGPWLWEVHVCGDYVLFSSVLIPWGLLPDSHLTPHPHHHIFTNLNPLQSRLSFSVVQMRQTVLYPLIDKYDQRVPTCKYKTISFLDHNIESDVHTIWSLNFTVFLTRKQTYKSVIF